MLVEGTLTSETLKEQLLMQILDLLKSMNETLGQIWKIYKMVYGEELQETEETDEKIPDVPSREPVSE